MKKYLKMILLCLIIESCFSLVIADDAVKGMGSLSNDENMIKYGLKVNFRTKTYFITKFTEETKVHRIYPDSTIKDYNRELNYFTTTSIPTSPEEGFQKLVVTIDSMHYKFSEGDVNINFNSNILEGDVLRFKDLNTKTVPLGRTFNMIYSPYGEVARIDGDDIEETLTYVIEKGEGNLSDLERSIWLNGLSFEHLQYLGDVKKILSPVDKIAVDSVWYSPFKIELNGFGFNDTLAMKIVNYNAGVFEIVGESMNLEPLDIGGFSYNIKDVCSIQDVKGSGYYKMELRAGGQINSISVNYKVAVQIKVGDQIVEEMIESKMIWDILNVYRL